jgi:NAD(P)-dependent dehydrogenase (short-subunit alcohol dehydrogenase family)
MNHLSVARSVRELQNLDGRVALLSGGAGYLGSVMACSLAEMGASIAIADRNKEYGEQVCAFLSEKYSCDVAFFEVDLSNDEQVSTIPHLVAKKFGRLDILVNAAAIVIDKFIEGWAVDFENQKSNLWANAMQVNLTSAFTLSRESSTYLKKDSSGSIVNIISHYGLVGPDWSLYEGTSMGNAAAYAASKGGLLQLTKWLSSTLAPEIRVNSITPGGIFRNHEDPFLSRYKAKTPMQRMGTEEDFKGAILFLASDLSSYITGHNLVVDGGVTII